MTDSFAAAGTTPNPSLPPGKGLLVQGLPVVLDIDGKLESLIEDTLNGDEQFRGGPVANQGTDRRGMPTVNYGSPGERWPGLAAAVDRPKIRLNQLYWPTGMSRYGEMWVMMSGRDASLLTSYAWNKSQPSFNWQPSQTFRLLPTYYAKDVSVSWRYDNDPAFSAKMYVESITGVSRWVYPALEPDDLVCVHLVDYRYYLQQIGFGCTPSGYPVVTGAPDPFAELPGRHHATPRTWKQLCDACLAQAQITTTNTNNITNDLLVPSPDVFDRCGDNLAHLMDAIAESMGGRWNYYFDGKASLAAGYRLDEHRDLPSMFKARLDNLSFGPLPGPSWSHLVVLYPKCINGKVLTYGERYYWQMMLHGGKNPDDIAAMTPIDPITNTFGVDTQSHQINGMPGVAHVVHSSCLAQFADVDTVAPVNEAALRKLTQYIAKWAVHNSYTSNDATMTAIGAPGVRIHQHIGWHEFIMVDFGVEGAPEYRLRTGGEWSEARGALPEKQAPPELVTTRKRRLKTHVRCAKIPPPRINLSYDHTVPVVIEPYFKIKSAYTLPYGLFPGSYAYGTYVVYNTGTSSWDNSDPLLDDVKIYDPRHLACALPGEIVHCRWSDERKRWEVDEAYGLHRKAVVKAVAGIPAGGSGACEIYHNDAATGMQVTVHLIWMDQGQPVAYDKEIYIHHDSGEKRWWMPGAECPGGTSGSSSH